MFPSSQFVNSTHEPAIGNGARARSRCERRGSHSAMRPRLFGEIEALLPTAVIFAIGALTILRLWAASHVGLVPDEAYYWLWSRTPDFGYADHPPMIAWWIWLSTRVLGDSALGIRALSVLSALMTSIAVYGIGTQLWNRAVALRAVLWFNATILVGVGAILSTPDAPSTMFWALAVWALSAIFRTQRSWLWIVVGVFAGLGCVSKYTNLFFGLGIVAWLVVDPAGHIGFGVPGCGPEDLSPVLYFCQCSCGTRSMIGFPFPSNLAG